MKGKRIWTSVAAFCMAILPAMAGDPQPSTPAADADAGGIALVLKTTFVKCPTCEGKGKLVARPPDMGQYEGRMEARQHWDVLLDPCPTCGGRRRLKTYDTGPRDPMEGVKPCPACGWSGLKPCRRCRNEGLVKCNGTNCRSGWIITPSRDKKHHPAPTVRPCSVCRGIGRIKCYECQGMRATVCPKCFGTGRKMK